MDKKIHCRNCKKEIVEGELIYDKGLDRFFCNERCHVSYLILACLNDKIERSLHTSIFKLTYEQIAQKEEQNEHNVGTY